MMNINYNKTCSNFYDSNGNNNFIDSIFFKSDLFPEVDLDLNNGSLKFMHLDFNLENEDNINYLFGKGDGCSYFFSGGNEDKYLPEKTTKEYSNLKIENKDSNLNVSSNSITQKEIIKIAKKIFNIVKKKKKNTKIGRANKNIKNKYQITHDKFSMDNIIRKVKASFLLRTMKFINHEYGQYLHKRQRK